MQEDVAGTLRTIGYDTDTCSLCGDAYPTDQLISVEADPSDGVVSDREYVCPRCYESLAQGEARVYPADSDDYPESGE